MTGMTEQRVTGCGIHLASLFPAPPWRLRGAFPGQESLDDEGGVVTDLPCRLVKSAPKFGGGRASRRRAGRRERRVSGWSLRPGGVLAPC